MTAPSYIQGRLAKSFVYYNLHKSCWSVQVRGKIQRHATTLGLRDVQFRVREAGRQRVIKEKRKNVHAFCVGEQVTGLRTFLAILGDLRPVEVSYNPYRGGSFYRKDTGENVKGARFVWMRSDRKVFAFGIVT
jgi:hypothetical protein